MADPPPAETVLTGGNMTPVARVGDTVRRGGPVDTDDPCPAAPHPGVGVRARARAAGPGRARSRDRLVPAGPRPHLSPARLRALRRHPDDGRADPPGLPRRD